MEINAKYIRSRNLVFDTGHYPFDRRQRFIRLYDGPSILGTATVCLEYWEPEIPNPFVAIKTWSENEGILEELIRLGVLEKTGFIVPAGFASAAICTITDAGKKALGIFD